ncbi:hypothetical protein [Halorubrum sp. BOL3-1]|nr:hypothetical protein [Halorubrum sp. BOL3-1]
MIEVVSMGHPHGVLLSTGATSLTGIALTICFVILVNIVMRVVKNVFD